MMPDNLQLFAQTDTEGGETAAAASSETENADEAQQSANEEPRQDNEREFEEIIKGKYASEFAKRTQSIIDKRFGKFKELEKTANAVKPLLSRLRLEHPEIDPTNEEALFAVLMENDDKTIKTPNNDAEKNGKTAVAAAGVLAREKAEQKMQNELIDAWKKQGEELRKIYPTFSLENEITADGDFGKLLRAGVSVRKAYEVANIENIVGAAMKFAANNAAKKTADSIRQGQARVKENSVLNRAAAVMHTDVRSLTERDILNIIGEVSKGAKITFG